MDSQLTPLEQLRQEIDRIDDAMHDLLMQRARVVEQIAKVKPPGKPVWRPAREAQILRRLLERHSGPVPPQAVIRLWREIIGIFSAQQGTVTIAAAGADEVAVRRHFGDFIEFHAGDPVEGLADGGITIGVAPWPSDVADWWTRLPAGVHVVATLPFGAAKPTHVAIGRIEPETTGEDVTWIAARDISDFLGDTLAETQGWTLLQLPGAMQADDPAFQNADVRYVGSFAKPYTARTI